MPKAIRSRYAGDLKTPLRPFPSETGKVPGAATRLLTDMSDAQIAQSKARAKAEIEGFLSQEMERVILPRMQMLAEHYGIPLGQPDTWFRLALRLAIEHVPGFQREKKKGRPLKTRDILGSKEFQIWVQVSQLLAIGGHSELNACRLVLERLKKADARTKATIESVRSTWRRFDHGPVGQAFREFPPALMAVVLDLGRK